MQEALIKILKKLDESLTVVHREDFIYDEPELEIIPVTSYKSFNHVSANLDY